MNFGVIDVFMIFFITMGPLKSSIVYVTLTAEADAGFRRRVAIKTVVTSTVVAVLFVVAGEFMLKAFHVSIPALKIAGGLILLLFALEMMVKCALAYPGSLAYLSHACSVVARLGKAGLRRI